jgi:TPP-dependent indolepyruvate ferredoxin oxidoreductase alpha subunit
MKAHGLAKAGNAVVASLSAGVGAGLVALVFDDEAGQHSDNILSARRLCEGLELPWRHVGEGVSVYDDVRRGFEVSEALGLPVALIMPSHQMASLDAPTRGAGWGPAPGLRPVARDVARRLVCPPLSGYQRRVFEAKRRRLDPDAVPRPTLPRVPDDLPPQLRTTATRYAPFFDAFCAVRGDDAVVTGDAGTSALFGLPPYGCVDWCAYMGGSVPMGVGAAAARGGEVWALSGDFSFVSAAHLGLLEAVARGVALKVVVFADGAASATGGQPVPRALLDTVLAAYRADVREVARPEDAGAVRAALRAMARCDTLCVLVLDYRSAVA